MSSTHFLDCKGGFWATRKQLSYAPVLHKVDSLDPSQGSISYFVNALWCEVSNKLIKFWWGQTVMAGVSGFGWRLSMAVRSSLDRPLLKCFSRYSVICLGAVNLKSSLSSLSRVGSNGWALLWGSKVLLPRLLPGGGSRSVLLLFPSTLSKRSLLTILLCPEPGEVASWSGCTEPH